MSCSRQPVRPAPAFLPPVTSWTLLPTCCPPFSRPQPGGLLSKGPEHSVGGSAWVSGGRVAVSALAGAPPGAVFLGQPLPP